MSRIELDFGAGCGEDWEEMAQRDGGRRRACASCAKEVTDLSMMTEREALALLEDMPAGMCARVLHDEQGRALFRPEPPEVLLAHEYERGTLSVTALRGRSSALAALAIAAPLALGACEPSDRASAQAPIELRDGAPARLGASSRGDLVPSEHIHVAEPEEQSFFEVVKSFRPSFGTVRTKMGDMSSKVTEEVHFK